MEGWGGTWPDDAIDEDGSIPTRHEHANYTDGLRDLAEHIREQKTANWLAVSSVLDDCAELIDGLSQ